MTWIVVRSLVWNRQDKGCIPNCFDVLVLCPVCPYTKTTYTYRSPLKPAPSSPRISSSLSPMAYTPSPLRTSGIFNGMILLECMKYFIFPVPTICTRRHYFSPDAGEDNGIMTVNADLVVPRNLLWKRTATIPTTQKLSLVCLNFKKSPDTVLPDAPASGADPRFNDGLRAMHTVLSMDRIDEADLYIDGTTALEKIGISCNKHAPWHVFFPAFPNNVCWCAGHQFHMQMVWERAAPEFKFDIHALSLSI